MGNIELDKDEKKRLKKLQDEYDEKLTYSDLLLLLEHDKRMQETVRAITAPGAAINPAQLAQLAKLEQENQQLNTQLVNSQAQIKLIRNELSAAKAERDSTNVELNSHRQAIAKQKVWLDIAAQVSADTELCKFFGLADALHKKDFAALVVMVAVFAQMENIKRLFDFFKDRCTRNRYAATAQEQQCLVNALEWHNHNWQQRPFCLLTPICGEPYDYAAHQRATTTPTGEKIAELWLPGIEDSNHRPICKALVATL